MAFLRAMSRMPTGWRPRTSACTWCLVCGFVFLGELKLPAQTALAREYQVKAVFLFNFAEFVEWPPAAFADDTSPIVIADDVELALRAFEKSNTAHTIVVARDGAQALEYLSATGAHADARSSLFDRVAFPMADRAI